ncbi:MAG TPA: GAF domain-containing SpoIIE family protein phosphatase [Bryobacteraceae bacterium]|nr:GAF domain-containing SpoIIE family protein phosphatase [Bryobacteraceae bacterium]
MARLTLRTLLGAKSGALAPLSALLASLEGPFAIENADGNVLLGTTSPGSTRIEVVHADSVLGTVSGPRAGAEAVAAMLIHLADKEAERRALAGEVLHLYREVHLIEHLSEELTALLDVSAVSRAALDQIRRMIAASSGGILVRENAGAPLRYVADFGDAEALPEPASAYAVSVLERGVPEIVNVAEMFAGAGSPAGATGTAASLRSLIFAPMRAKQQTVGMIVLANDTGDPYKAADLQLLNTVALQTAAAIENAALCAEMVNAARYREQLTAIQRELDTARAIQHSLVPRVFPPFPARTDFDIHAQMTSARAVGGDFFDFFLIDDDHLGIVIGDVSGKGTPAALYMAVTHTHVRSTALRGLGPGECLAEVNRVLVADNASSMFATCFYGILDTRTGQLQYSSAGHNPPYRIGAAGAVEPLESAGGTPLGMFQWKNYESASLQLAPGDSLFLYTDGVPEANNSELEDFTNERLEKVLGLSATLPTREIVSTVNSEVLAFTAGAPQSDDITIMAVRRSTN